MMTQAIKTIRTLLPFSGSITKQQIEEAVTNVLLLPMYSALDKDSLIREIESLYNIQMDDFRIIEAAERRLPWINDAKANINWNFWNRYRDYMREEKNFSDTVLNQLDRLTDRTLDGLFNPTQNIVLSKYGLVVGQVQSGKTSNYAGLICKGADSGFKLIIVLAGIHNNLRSQTQLRLDEGFLGFDTQHQRAFDQNGIAMGVGRFDQSGIAIAHSLTSSLEKGDFTAGAANSMGINFHTPDPIIAVVKKNSRVLERLLLWLTAQSVEMPDGRKVIRNKSLLMIDDEADNASINTNPDDDTSTRINTLIRDTLRLFDKSGYVGYTATPFANIFIPIEEDQIFPRDFIINIPAPSNYIGPEKVFGIKVLEDDDESDTVLPIVNRVDDFSTLIPNGHRRDSAMPDTVPPSLMTAIKCFILTCAIRRLRGQTTNHNSMLIHVSRFIAWQAHIKILVENTFDFYRRGIEMKIPSVLDELRKAFEDDYEYTTEYRGETFIETYKSFKTVSQTILDTNADVDSQVQVHEWTDVLAHLHEAATRIQVKEINGGSGDALNYYDHKNGLSVITIGGDKLSRGLTLEGLSVSYYLRASRMYDTLMQMGRWFGYRPGYADLCRLFTSRELNEWFCHITLASDELRAEFDYMADVAGSTPEQYALRVRTHPGVLQISASNKIRRAVNVEISWAGRLVESYQLQKNPSIINSNLRVTTDLINSLSNSFEHNSNNFLWRDVAVELVRPFFQRFRVSDNLKKVEPSKLLDFIDASAASNELRSWRIAVITKDTADVFYPLNSTNGIAQVGCVIRSHDKTKNDILNLHLIKNHIIRPNDEFFDLSKEDYAAALARTIEYTQRQGKEYKYNFPKGEIVRNEFRKNPLLMIYFIDAERAGMPIGSEPMIGFAISFPKSRFNTTVRYAIHQQLLPLFNIDDNIEEIPDDED